MISPGIRNILLTGVLGLLLYNTDPTNDKIVLLAQSTVIGHLFLGIFLNFYIRYNINKRQDEQTLRIPQSIFSWRRLPPDQDEWKTMTVQQYDLEELKRAQHRFVLNAVFLGFAGLRMGATRATILQGALWMLQLIESPLVQIYVFNQPAEGRLSRPFEKNRGLLQMLLQGSGKSSTPQGEETINSSVENKKDN
eukprot:jgi/Galph1/2959/GphlegSOOS_G1604.1